MKLLSILSAVLLVIGGGFMMLRPETPVATNFFWLDWDHNAVSENVQYYTLYIGSTPNPTSKIALGYQNSIQVIQNNASIYAQVTATNSTGESPRSNQVHVTQP